MIYINVYRFSWISEGPGGQDAWRPVPPCGALRQRIGSPYILRSQILGAWVWRPGSGGLDVWMLKDWNGLGEVTEVTALWGEGIGRNSHTLKLQELGGF
jgi:hypothetical protein